MAPCVRRHIRPWSPRELSRLLQSAQTIPGDVGSIPAELWWPAFILVTIELEAFPQDVFRLPASSFDAARGRLSTRDRAVNLHPLTLDALNRLRPIAREILLPWPKDGGHSPWCMLYCDYKQVLWRAGLSPVTENLVSRLVATGRNRSILDLVDVSAPFTPLPGRVRFPRARNLRAAQARAAKREALILPGKDGRYEPVRDVAQRMTGKRPSDATIHTWVYGYSKAGKLDAAKIHKEWHCTPQDLAEFLKRRGQKPECDSATGALREWFERVYVPHRLYGKQKTVACYARTLNRLRDFLCREPDFTDLRDETCERFTLWLRPACTPGGVNRHLRHLLALWRFAWRKGKTETLPRDVELLREPKRLPEAWSPEQIALILDSAAREQGMVAGITARRFWRALILTLYYTGLRVDALLSVDSDALDSATGWLTVPAEVQKQQAAQVFQLPPDALQALREIRPQDRRVLFGGMETKRLRGKLKRILTRAGLPAGSQHLFHKLRRSSATMVASALGEEAARLHLGHSHIQTTRRYIDPRLLKRVQATSHIPRPEPSEPADC